MATITPVVLKLTQVHGVVKVRGSAGDTGTITLATILKKSGETASTPTANIKTIYWSLGTGCAATISRNSTTLWTLNDQGSGYLDFAGFADNEFNTNDVVIAFTGTAAGTIVVELAKVSGYGNEQHQIAPLDTAEGGSVKPAGGSLI
jgi:hypothetical protein